jgi:hypothetical protein
VITSNSEELEKLGSKFNFFDHKFLSSLLLPAMGKIFQKTALCQTVVNQADISCALERYRLANGKLPETLDALAPKFIEKVPRDLIGGEPLNYRRKDDNHYVLYSVGWNEKDDGGVVVFGKGERAPMNIFQGDWVWPEYPAK